MNIIKQTYLKPAFMVGLQHFMFAGVSVRMMHQGRLAVGLPDLLLGTGFFNTQQFVEVTVLVLIIFSLIFI